MTPGSEPSIPLEAVFALLPTPLEVSCRWHAAERAADCRVPESGERASCRDATKNRSLFPGGLFLPEVRHVSAPAPFKSGFSAPEETRASQFGAGLRRVTVLSPLDDVIIVIFSLLLLRRLAQIKKPHKLKSAAASAPGGASVCPHSAADGAAELPPTLEHLFARCRSQSLLDKPRGNKLV